VPSGFPELLSPALQRQLSADQHGRDPLAYPRAAIRETFEETGLLIADPATTATESGSSTAGAWGAFAAQRLAPAFGRLEYVCRAITPTSSRRRYNTRFFLARGATFGGSIAGDGELDDLNWWPLAEIPRLNLVDVTAFVLEEALRLWRAPAATEACLPPLATYRNDIFRIRRRG
jgi:8-oxo-dGTP pyrophosphatase MutT (NUDIX family)